MRAVAYVLFDPGAPPDSPASRAGREGEVAHFCQRNGHTLATVFADPDGPEGREALTRMFQHIEEQPAEFLVLVTDPGHLGTTPEEAVEAVLRVDGLGSRVVCTTEGQPDPLQGLFRLLSAAGPGAERRQRILEAMESKALRGEGLGKPPYGYRIGADGRLEEVPAEAELVRRMFRLYLEEGMGLRTIARYLNQHGYLTRRGGGWSMVTLRDILRNRVYIGTYTRFGMRLLGNHPSLVPRLTFRRVQDLMASRSPRRREATAQPFLLSGLAYCVQCGNRMIGVTRRQTWRRKDGRRMLGIYRYYQCQSRANQSLCQYHTWRASGLEDTVAEQVRLQLRQSTEMAVDHHLPGRQSTASRREEAETRRRRRYMKYLRQAADGAISLRRLRFLLGRLGAAPREQREGEGPVPAHSGQDAVSGVQTILDPARWAELDYPSKRQTLQWWVERVEVADTEVHVKLRLRTAA